MKKTFYYWTSGCQVHEGGYDESERRCTCHVASLREVETATNSALYHLRSQIEEIDDPTN